MLPWLGSSLIQDACRGFCFVSGRLLSPHLGHQRAQDRLAGSKERHDCWAACRSGGGAFRARGQGMWIKVTSGRRAPRVLSRQAEQARIADIAPRIPRKPSPARRRVARPRSGGGPRAGRKAPRAPSDRACATGERSAPHRDESARRRSPPASRSARRSLRPARPNRSTASGSCFVSRRGSSLATAA